MRAARVMCVAVLSALTWSCTGGNEGSTGGGGTTGSTTGGTGGTTASGGGGSTASGGGGATGGGGMAGNGGVGGAGGIGGVGGAGGMTGSCAGLPGVDDDADGYSEDQGDCDDCDPQVNPGAAEVLTPPGETPKDEDCDLATDELDLDLLPCDDGLALDSADPIDAVKAIGFCDHAKFLQKATWVLADGLTPGPSVDMAKYHLGHGLSDHFGTNDVPPEGHRMLALSSGTARNTNEPGFVSRNFDKGYSSSPPVPFTGEMPACPGVTVPTSSVQDAAALELEIKAPSNVSGLSFRFDFRTHDFPQYVCTQFTDFFWVNFIQGNTHENVTFEDNGNLVGASSAFIHQCECPPAGPGQCSIAGQPLSFDCAGVDLLAGTDFDGSNNPMPAYQGWSNAGTEWLTTWVPVNANQPFKLRFVIWDSGVNNGVKDHNLDSTVLIDEFRWHTEPITNHTAAN